MTAIWTPPITWTGGSLVTAAMFREQIRDNLEYLFTPNFDEITLDETDISTTATSFTDVDAAGGSDLSLQVETYGEDVVVHFRGTVGLVNSSTNNCAVCFDISVDGQPFGGDDGVITYRHWDAQQSTRQYFGADFSVRVAGLTAGVHTFTLRWKVSGAGGTTTATLYCGDGTAVGLDTHPQMWVVKG